MLEADIYLIRNYLRRVNALICKSFIYRNIKSVLNCVTLTRRIFDGKSNLEKPKHQNIVIIHSNK